MATPAITRSDVDTLSKAQQAVIAEAKRELGKAWAETEGMDPAQRRDALIDLVQAIIHKYGLGDSQAAATWYEIVRSRWFDDSFEVEPWEQDPNADARLVRAIRAKANMLFPEDPGYNPEAYLSYLNGLVDRNVHSHGQLTVAHNVKRDHRGVRYARVPSGGETCQFCFMLCSRGYVYRSADSGSFHAHANDRCELVPQFKAGTAKVKGYDPDKMADLWVEASDAVGSYDGDASGKLNQTFAILRANHPELFTGADGRVH